MDEVAAVASETPYTRQMLGRRPARNLTSEEARHGRGRLNAAGSSLSATAWSSVRSWAR
jgi:hypothetical protein